MLGATPKPFSI